MTWTLTTQSERGTPRISHVKVMFITACGQEACATGDIYFERCRDLPDRERTTKNTLKLHYGSFHIHAVALLDKTSVIWLLL